MFDSLSESMRRSVCPNIEAGLFMCETGNMRTALLGLTWSYSSRYPLQSTAGSFEASIESSSLSHAYLAINRHCGCASFSLSVLKKALMVSRSSFSESYLPSGELKNRSEEHTSELQSQSNLVCRLLL